MRLWLFLLLCLLPLFALGEGVSVALTSCEKHEQWHEELLEQHWILGKEASYYSFGNESKLSGLITASNETDYQLFKGLTNEKASMLIRRLSSWETWWVRVQVIGPPDIRLGIENFRFIEPREDVWVKMVLEEMDSILGYLWVGDEPMGLKSGEYHLRVMARKGVDLKTALAGLVCDVTFYPGMKWSTTQTVTVQTAQLREESHERPVEVQALRARRMLDEDARIEIEDTAGFWDDSDFDLEPLDLKKEDLWEITAEISKESGYPLVGFSWKGSGVGGGWRHRLESPTVYDCYMDLWPEETRREVTFYVRVKEDDNAGKVISDLRQKDIGLEYATEYVGDWENLYTPGPKYQVKVDMSKVELAE